MVAMVAVFYGVGYAVEKAQDEIVHLSKNEKMKEIIGNLLNAARISIGEKTWAGVVFLMNGIAMVGNGATVVNHWAIKVARGVGNGAAAIWETIAIWTWFLKKKEVQTENNEAMKKVEVRAENNEEEVEIPESLFG